MTKLKLDKAQEKRFDEFVKEHHTTTQVEPRLLTEDDAKQHLVDELARERKKIFKMWRNALKGYRSVYDVDDYEKLMKTELDQAIKSIK